MPNRCIVPVESLTKHVDLTKYKFETTEDLKSLASVIGQERAVSSINFALEIDDSGYNIFVTGSYGTGRTTIVSDLLKQASKNRPTPSDWVFVYNFENTDEPKALELPAGQANLFRKRMNRLINSLRADLQKAFDSKSYSERRNEILNDFQTRKQTLFTAVEKEAADLNLRIKSSSMGFVTIPLKDDNVINAKDFENLTVDEKQSINNNIAIIQKRLQEMVRSINHLDREMAEQIDELDENVARFVVDNHFVPMIEIYENIADVKNYLHDAADHIIDNVGELVGQANDKGQGQDEENALPYKLNKYQINVVIDNSRQKGAPVIYETNPTYNNLFGRLEKKSYQGYIYTDYTMIKSGSLLSANGGYLILDADQLLKHSFAYEALKRALRSKKLRIEDINTFYGYSSTVSLKPDPVPLNIKVVLIGQASIFRLLHNYDEEFRKIFKVRADFDVEVKENNQALGQYIRFITRVVKEENLMHIDRDGIVAIIEYGHRLSDHQQKLSIRFGELVKIIRESSFWAKKHNKKLVSRSDVNYAIQNKIYRHDLVEEKVHDSIIKKVINVDVKGFKVGQINGLAVYDLGDYSFGRPSRITINTYLGSRGIINIEREAKLSGRIHDKGILVLSGYFSQTFGTRMPLSFSASIVFEQNYGTIDGDSASSAELYGLLSSLSQVPLNQGIAVTGSVNQKGEVQAIGGVNEKIEGFFKVCKARGLSGEQGVIIPRANVRNLVLNQEVISAVKQGRFRIWAVDNILDGMQILTGRPCGRIHKDGSYTKDSVFELVRKRLVEFARTSRHFHKTLDENEEKKDEKEQDENDD